MATWYDVIAGAMTEAANDLLIVAERFKKGELNAWEARADLSKVRMTLDGSEDSLTRLAEQEAERSTDGSDRSTHDR